MVFEGLHPIYDEKVGHPRREWLFLLRLFGGTCHKQSIQHTMIFVIQRGTFSVGHGHLHRHRDTGQQLILDSFWRKGAVQLSHFSRRSWPSTVSGRRVWYNWCIEAYWSPPPCPLLVRPATKCLLLGVGLILMDHSDKYKTLMNLQKQQRQQKQKARTSRHRGSNGSVRLDWII